MYQDTIAKSITPRVLCINQQFARSVTPAIEHMTQVSKVYEQSLLRIIPPALFDFNKYFGQSIAPIIEQFQRSTAASVIPSLEKWQLQLPKTQPFIADVARLAEESSSHGPMPCRGTGPSLRRATCSR